MSPEAGLAANTPVGDQLIVEIFRPIALDARLIRPVEKENDQLPRIPKEDLVVRRARARLLSSGSR